MLFTEYQITVFVPTATVNIHNLSLWSLIINHKIGSKNSCWENAKPRIVMVCMSVADQFSQLVAKYQR